MIIRNDANHCGFFAYHAGRPPDSYRETEDRSGLNGGTGWSGLNSKV